MISRFAPLLLLPLLWSCSESKNESTPEPEPEAPQLVYTDDIDRWWTAYDSIRATPDTAQQRQILREVYLDPGSEGLEAIRQARRYSEDDFLTSIRDYPKFWASIRPNILRAKELGAEIEAGLQGFRQLYPDLEPAKIYFTVGAFRTGGTTVDNLVLIGSEIAMADKNTVTEEFPQNLGHLTTHFSGNPIKDIVFLNVHEFVHTQQAEALRSNLLTQCLREGVAELVAERATGQPSTAPAIAIAYGREHLDTLKVHFQREMFNRHYGFWLWSNQENPFGKRDLGYAVGYAMTQHYLKDAEDSEKALAKLMELNYSDDQDIIWFLETIDFFDQSMNELEEAYRAQQPSVTDVKMTSKGNQEGTPLLEVMVTFSEPMDERFGWIGAVPEFEDRAPEVTQWHGFSGDGLSCRFDVNLKSGPRNWLSVTTQFRGVSGIEVAPYIIEFDPVEE